MRLFSWVLVLCALSACRGDPLARDEASCGSQGRCAAGTVCFDGACRTLCNVSADCAAFEACVMGACIPTTDSCASDADCDMPPACRTAAGATCSSAGSCEYPAALDATTCSLGRTPGLCSSGVCVECVVAADCQTPATEYLDCVSASCEASRCVYVANPLAVCVAQGCDPVRDEQSGQRLCGADLANLCPRTGGEVPCPDGYGCNEAGSECLTFCASDSQCAAGFFCNSNACEPKRLDGASCVGLADTACSSGHCDGELCCASGDCCNAPADCPGVYTPARG